MRYLLSIIFLIICLSFNPALCIAADVLDESYTTGDDAQHDSGVPTYSADLTAPGGAVSVWAAGDEPISNAIDNDTATHFEKAGGTVGGWIKYDFGAGITKIARRYTWRTLFGQIHIRNAGTISNIDFQGSNNDVDWTTLVNLVDTGSTDNTVITKDFSNATAYRYYRWYFNGGAGGDGWGVRELEIMELTTPTPWTAQSFTPSASVTITRAELFLLRDASADGNVEVTIQTDATNKPSGTIAGSAATVAASTLGTTAGWINFDTGDFSATASTKYWIVLKRVNFTAGTVSWRYDGTAPTYAGGDDATSSDSGATWTVHTGHDALFKTYKLLPIQGFFMFF